MYGGKINEKIYVNLTVFLPVMLFNVCINQESVDKIIILTDLPTHDHWIFHEKLRLYNREMLDLI